MNNLLDARRPLGRLFYCLIALLCAALAARAQGPAKTTIADTVYRADGTPAGGTLLLTWPQFNTADNKAVAAGTLSVSIGAAGSISIQLAPNQGATPSGTYYKVVYQLDDGTSSTEYWVVPAASPATITAVRSLIVPANVAAQIVSRSYVDSQLTGKADASAVVMKAGDTMTGPLVLSADPASAAQASTKNYVDAQLAAKATDTAVVHKSGDTMTGSLVLNADPSTAAQAATKNYVDTQIAPKATDTAVVHKSGDTMTGALTLSGAPASALQAATKAYVDTKAVAVPGQFAVDSSTYTTIQAAITAAGSNGSVLIPSNYAGTDTYTNPNNIQIVDLRPGTDRYRGFVNVVSDCGAKGDGVTDDSAAIQACLNGHPGSMIYFPKTSTGCAASYYSAATLVPVGVGQILMGGGASYANSNACIGGTYIKFASGVGGIKIDGVQGVNVIGLGLMGPSSTAQQTSPTALVLPGASVLPLSARNISSIQRTSSILTVSITPLGAENLDAVVNSTVSIAGVTGDTTMNGLCVIASISGGQNGNPSTFTCPQNGGDAGPFGAVGTVSPSSTGPSTADGIRICGTFVTIHRVVVQGFGRHGMNADTGAGCASPFSDDFSISNSVMVANQGDGFFCRGADCNAGTFYANAMYYNGLWGVDEQGFLGNTYSGNQASYQALAVAAATTPATKAISAIARTLTNNSSTVSVTLGAADTNIQVGSCVVIAGVTDSSFNTTAGQCYFVTVLTDSTHYQYIQPGAPASASSSGGTSRIAKFSEAYLSSGLDYGAYKMDTTQGSAVTLTINDYAEGGQVCKWNTSVVKINGVGGVTCAQYSTWYPVYYGKQTSVNKFTNFADNQNDLFIYSGATSNQIKAIDFMDYLGSTYQWRFFGDGTGNNFTLYRGFNTERMNLINGGKTNIDAEGSAAVEFNNYGTSTSGTGGIKVCSGGTGPTCPTTIDGAGNVTAASVSAASFKSSSGNVASAGALRLASSDALNFRNAANTGDVTGLGKNASDQIVLGGSSGVVLGPQISNSANPAQSGWERLASGDAINFRNAANTGDIAGVSKNANDQVLLGGANGTVASAFISSAVNPAAAGALRLANTDTLAFRNSLNTADVTATMSGDTIVLGNATSGISSPGPITSSGLLTGATFTVGGDASVAANARVAWGSFLPGALNALWTAAQFTPKKGISIVQIEARAKTGPVGCTTFPVIQLTDGTTNVNTTLNASNVTNNIAGGQNYAANAVLSVKVSTAAGGCTTVPADVNVTIQYKMQ